MAKNQKSYTPEFKQQIVDLYHTGGYSYPQLEREYGVGRSTISGWVKQLSPIQISQEETVTLKELKTIQKEYEAFGKEVKQAFDESKGRYDAVKICRSLNDSGIPCSLKRVQRHMKSLELRSVVVKKYNHSANKGNDKENILKRDFKADMIHQKWCTDITYIHVLKEGWTYLASVMDLGSRKIVGYVYGTSMTAELALDAVKNACMNVKNTEGIILPFRTEKRRDLFTHLSRLQRSQ